MYVKITGNNGVKIAVIDSGEVIIKDGQTANLYFVCNEIEAEQKFTGNVK